MSAPLAARSWALALRLACIGLLAGVAAPAGAVMAGALPDTPALRVDANTAASPWNATVSVLVNGAHYSGVVIAPRFVLTAAHVVGSAPAAQVQVRLNLDAPGTLIAAAAVTRFPGHSFPYDDLAIVELVHDVPDAVSVPSILTQPPDAALTLTVLGHGGSGQGNDGSNWVNGSAAVKRRGNNALDVVLDHFGSDTRRSTFYLFDFDGPSGNGSLGGPTLGNAVETTFAGGDSGGPAYAQIGGSWRLVGINTFIAAAPGSTTAGSTFGNLGGGMLLSDSRFLNWIDQTTRGTAGQQPGGDVPLPAWALGALGTALVASLAGRRRRAASPQQRPVR